MLEARLRPRIVLDEVDVLCTSQTRVPGKETAQRLGCLGLVT